MVEVGESFYYELPEMIDYEGQEIGTQISLGTASPFVQFDSNSFKISENATTSADVG